MRFLLALGEVLGRNNSVRRGFEIAALDEPWVAERVKMPYEELLTDIRLLTAEGQLISGADVYLYVTRRIWWAWPFYAIFSLPGFNRLIHVGYRWFARNRYCVSACVQAAAALKNPLFDAQRQRFGASFCLETRHLGALRLPDPHFMPSFKGVPYWEPHKICIKCYFSTA